MSLWDEIGRQFRHPNGLVGCLAGHAMGMVNEKPNRLAIDALRVGVRDTILELGFGPGRGIALMAARATQGMIYGVDQSATMLEQAGRANRLAIRQGRVSLHRSSFDCLPFADASIDKILAVNVVYFWEDPVAIANEIRRVLRPDGSVSIYATDAATMRHWKFAGPDTHRLFRAAELNDVLLRGGFDRNRIFVRSVQMSGRVKGLLATVSAPAKVSGFLRR